MITIHLFRGSFDPTDDGFANDAYYRWLDSSDAHDSEGQSPTINERLVRFVDRLVSACHGKQTRATDHLIVALGKKVYDHHSEGWSWFYAQPEAQRLWDAQEREHNRHMARHDRKFQ